MGQNFGYVVAQKNGFFFSSVNLNRFPKKRGKITKILKPQN
jgi:hypothetical protein